MKSPGSDREDDGIAIVRLSSDRWAEYRDIRLRALQDEPSAFGASYDEVKDRSEKEWRDSLTEDSASTKWHLFAESNGKIVGTVTARREAGKKHAHIAFVFGVYVVPEMRSKGIGRKLLSQLLMLLESDPAIIKICLNVSATQTKARALYQSLGFKDVALLEKELNLDGTYIDEYLMVKFAK